MIRIKVKHEEKNQEIYHKKLTGLVGSESGKIIQIRNGNTVKGNLHWAILHNKIFKHQ